MVLSLRDPLTYPDPVKTALDKFEENFKVFMKTWTPQFREALKQTYPKSDQGHHQNQAIQQEDTPIILEQMDPIVVEDGNIEGFQTEIEGPKQPIHQCPDPLIHDKVQQEDCVCVVAESMGSEFYEKNEHGEAILDFEEDEMKPCAEDADLTGDEDGNPTATEVGDIIVWKKTTVPRPPNHLGCDQFTHNKVFDEMPTSVLSSGYIEKEGCVYVITNGYQPMYNDSGGGTRIPLFEGAHVNLTTISRTTPSVTPLWQYHTLVGLKQRTIEIKLNERGGSVIHIVDHMNLEARSWPKVLLPLYQSSSVRAQKTTMAAVHELRQTAQEVYQSSDTYWCQRPAALRARSQRLSRGFNEAFNWFTDEGWSLMGTYGTYDVTVLVNYSPDKLMGLNLTFTIGFSSNKLMDSKALQAVSDHQKQELQNKHHMEVFGLQVVIAGYDRQVNIADYKSNIASKIRNNLTNPMKVLRGFIPVDERMRASGANGKLMESYMSTTIIGFPVPLLPKLSGAIIKPILISVLAVEKLLYESKFELQVAMSSIVASQSRTTRGCSTEIASIFVLHEVHNIMGVQRFSSKAIKSQNYRTTFIHGLRYACDYISSAEFYVIYDPGWFLEDIIKILWLDFHVLLNIFQSGCNHSKGSVSYCGINHLRENCLNGGNICTGLGIAEDLHALPNSKGYVAILEVFIECSDLRPHSKAATIGDVLEHNSVAYLKGCDVYVANSRILIGRTCLIWWTKVDSAISHMGLFQAKMSNDAFQFMRGMGMIPLTVTKSKYETTIVSIWCLVAGEIFLSHIKFLFIGFHVDLNFQDMSYLLNNFVALRKNRQTLIAWEAYMGHELGEAAMYRFVPRGILRLAYIGNQSVQYSHLLTIMPSWVLCQIHPNEILSQGAGLISYGTTFFIYTFYMRATIRLFTLTVAGVNYEEKGVRGRLEWKLTYLTPCVPDWLHQSTCF